MHIRLDDLYAVGEHVAALKLALHAEKVTLHKNSAENVVPVQRLTARATVILEKIAELGYEAKALPVSAKGQPGVRSEIFKALDGRHTLFPKSNGKSAVFKHAWDYLRKVGDISDV